MLEIDVMWDGPLQLTVGQINVMLLRHSVFLEKGDSSEDGTSSIPCYFAKTCSASRMTVSEVSGTNPIFSISWPLVG